MPKFYVVCNYCDNKWIVFSMTKEGVGKCPRCEDKSVKAVLEPNKIDYYEGSKPFRSEYEQGSVWPDDYEPGGD